MITMGENKARLNRFEEHKPEDIEWAKNLIMKLATGVADDYLASRLQKNMIKEQDKD